MSKVRSKCVPASSQVVFVPPLPPSSFVLPCSVVCCSLLSHLHSLVLSSPCSFRWFNWLQKLFTQTCISPSVPERCVSLSGKQLGLMERLFKKMLSFANCSQQFVRFLSQMRFKDLGSNGKLQLWLHTDCVNQRSYLATNWRSLSANQSSLGRP